MRRRKKNRSAMDYLNNIRDRKTHRSLRGKSIHYKTGGLASILNAKNGNGIYTAKTVNLFIALNLFPTYGTGQHSLDTFYIEITGYKFTR